MSTLSKETHKIQSDLSDYCRTDALPDIPGAKKEGLKTYRELVFGVVEDTLQSAYPITYKLLGEDQWLRLAEDFFAKHKCSNPQIWKMPFELIEHVQNTNYDKKIKKPWLTELLYFEWLEVEVYNMPDNKVENYASIKNWKEIIPVFNPDHRLVHFIYPVHQAKEEAILENTGNYFLLVYRSLEDYSVNFLEFSPFLAMLFEYLINNRCSISSALNYMKQEYPQFNITAESETSIYDFFRFLQSKGILLGTQKSA